MFVKNYRLINCFKHTFETEMHARKNISNVGAVLPDYE